MKDFFKGKIATIIILLATFILAGVAVFTAIRLYQLRQVAVAPNAPESNPLAAATPAPIACSLSFAIATPTPSPSPTPSPTPTPIPQCNSVCTSTSQCPTGMTCSVGFCRITECISEANCICATPTPSPSPSPSPTPSPTPTPSPSPSPSPTPSPTPTPSPSPTPSPVPQCNNNCTNNLECPSELICNIASGATSGNCRNPSCTSQTNCICTSVTPTPTSTLIAVGGTPAPTQPALPQSGTNWTTYFGVGIGIITIIGAFILAL